SGTMLSVSLLSPLGQGHYQLVLVGSSVLSGLDWSFLGGDGSDQTLADFTIVPKGVSLDDAISLESPGPLPSTTAGTLDFQANPFAVQLYKFTLPAGHHWQVGLEVTAQRDG